MLTVEERLARYRIVLDDEATVDDLPLLGAGHALPRGRRPVLVVAAITLIAAAIGTAVVVHRSAPATSVATPADPLGTWKQVASPTFGIASSSRAATASGGRIVVLGPEPHGPAAGVPFGGGLYSPSTDSWTTIPPGPFTDGAVFDVSDSFVMAVSLGEAHPAVAALLDLESMTWTPIELPPEVAFGGPVWAWDGNTLAVIRSGPTGVPGDTGAAPATWRWERQTGLWTKGATPPLAARSMPSTAAANARIAVWGGTTADESDPDARPRAESIPGGNGGTTPTAPPSSGIQPAPTQVYTNGAIYDIESDQWTLIPSNEQLVTLASIGAQAALSDSELVLVGGYSGETPRTTVSFQSGAWRILPSPTATGYLTGTDPNIVVVSTVNESGSHPVQYLDPIIGSWQEAPATTLIPTNRGMLALSASNDNPADELFHGALLTNNAWQPIADGPFTNRMDPAIAVVGDLVFVIGGEQGSNLGHQNDAWALDLAST